MGPYCKTPGPFRSAGVPPGASMWPKTFVHLPARKFSYQKMFLLMYHAQHDTTASYVIIA